jgi:hypothetical protein
MSSFQLKQCISKVSGFPREIKSKIYLVRDRRKNEGYLFSRDDTGNGELLFVEGNKRGKLLNPEDFVLKYTESTIEFDDFVTLIYYKIR